jgi:hypothetical protein
MIRSHASGGTWPAIGDSPKVIVITILPFRQRA